MQSLPNSTSLTYDDDGNLTSATNSLGVELVRSTYNTHDEVTSVTPTAGRVTQVGYTVNGDQEASWYFDGTGANQIQILNVTYYDDERRVVGSKRAVLPAGQFITANFETAVIPSQYVKSSSASDHNEVGQVDSTTDENGLITETTYNYLGQQIQTRQQRRNESGQIEWLVSRTVFDAVNRTRPFWRRGFA